jgi:hypothetical protein
MKAHFIFLIFILCSLNLSAQFRAIDFYVDLGVQDFPRTYNELVNVFDALSLEVTNSTNSTQNIYISIWIYKDGEWFARTKINYRGIGLTLQAYERQVLRKPQFEALDIMISESDVEFANGFNYSNPLNIVLPEGFYTICPVAYDANKPISEEFQLSDAYPITCGEMYFLEHNIQPISIFPVDEACVQTSHANEPIVFNWFVPTADISLREQVSYIFKIIDITNAPANPLDQIFGGTEVGFEQVIPPGVFNGTYAIFPYDFNLQIGHTYAWRVQVVLPGRDPSVNDFQEFTEIKTFQFGNCMQGEEWGDGETEEQDQLDECACELITVLSEEPHPNLSNVNFFQAGRFNVYEDVQKGGFSRNNIDQTINGRGWIRLSFVNNVKIEVDLENVKINEDGRMYAGVIKAVEDDGFNMRNYLNEVDSYTGSDYAERAFSMIPEFGTIENFINMLGNIANLINDVSSSAKRGMPLGIEYQIANDNDKIVLGVTRIHLTPYKAYYNLVVNFPFNWGDKNLYISMGGWVCGGPGGFANDVNLYMINDFDLSQVFNSINPARDLNVVFKGGGFSTSFDDSFNGSHIHFSCNGIESVGLAGEIHLPTDYFVKEDQEGNRSETDPQVKLEFFGNITDIQSGINWMAGITTGGSGKFQIRQLPGWGFSLQEATLDMSEIVNPDGIPNNLIDGDLLWKGLFIKEASLHPPKIFSTQRTGVIVNNLIIDPQISCEISAGPFNLLETDRLGGWEFRIDEVSMKITKNNFGGSPPKIKGRLGVPFLDYDFNVSANDIKRALEFNADIPKFGFDRTQFPELPNIETPEFYYKFTVGGQNRKYSMSAWAAELNITNSIIEVEYNSSASQPEEKWKIDAILGGNISINVLDVIDLIPEARREYVPNLTVELLRFELAYNNTSGFNSNSRFAKIDGNSLSWFSDNSPLTGGGPGDQVSSAGSTSGSSVELSNRPSEVMGFDFSIDNIRLRANPGDWFKPGLQASIQVGLVSGNDGFAASTTFTIWTKIKDSDGFVKKIVYDDVKVNNLRVFAQVSSFFLDGSLTIYKDNDEADDSWGDGFRGSLGVGMPCNISGFLGAGFGRKGSGDNRFTWWYAEGLVILGSVAIPMGPMSLYGFGGGIYYNVEIDKTVNTGRINELVSVDESEEGSGTYDFENKDEGIVPTGTYQEFDLLSKKGPKQGEIAFAILGVIGLTTGQEQFNMDVMLSASFSLNSGIQEISVSGDAYFMTPIKDRNDPQIKASVDLRVEFPYQGGFIFTGDLRVTVNMPRESNPLVKITGSVKAAMRFDSNNPEDWYLYVGNPYTVDLPYNRDPVELRADSPGTLEVKVLNFATINVTTYFLMGSGIPPFLPDVHPGIREMLSKVSNSDDEGSIKDGLTSIDLHRPNNGVSGVAFGSTLSFEAKGEFAVIGFNLKILAGFDFNLTHQPSALCAGNPIGLNGWYSTGQVFAGFNGGVYLINKFPMGPRRIYLLEATAVALVMGGGPDPWWIRGGAGVQFSVLGGMWEGSTYFEFSLGTECNPSPQNPFGIDIVESSYPEDGSKDVSPAIVPTIRCNVGLGQTFNFSEYSERKDGTRRRTRHSIKPILYSHKIEINNGNGFVDIKNIDRHPPMKIEMRDNGRTILFLTEGGEGLKLNKEYKISIVVRAENLDPINPSNYRYPNSPYWMSRGRPWEYEYSFSFKTSERLENYHQFVKVCYPLHGRSYVYPGHYPDNEYGIKLARDLTMDGFYLTGSPAAGGGQENPINRLRPQTEYVYEADVIDAMTNTLIGRYPLDFNKDGGRIDEFTFIGPQLDTKKAYIFRLSRKLRNTIYRGPFDPALAEALSSFQSQLVDLTDVKKSLGWNPELEGVIERMEDWEHDININLNEEDDGLPIYMDDRVDQLIAVWFFRTSKYNTFYEKISQGQFESKFVDKPYLPQLDVRIGHLEVTLDEPLDDIETGTWRGIYGMRLYFGQQMVIPRSGFSPFLPRPVIVQHITEQTIKPYIINLSMPKPSYATTFDNQYSDAVKRKAARLNVQNINGNKFDISYGRLLRNYNNLQGRFNRINSLIFKPQVRLTANLPGINSNTVVSSNNNVVLPNLLNIYLDEMNSLFSSALIRANNYLQPAFAPLPNLTGVVTERSLRNSFEYIATETVTWGGASGDPIFSAGQGNPFTDTRNFGNYMGNNMGDNTGGFVVDDITERPPETYIVYHDTKAYITGTFLSLRKYFQQVNNFQLINFNFGLTDGRRLIVNSSGQILRDHLLNIDPVDYNNTLIRMQYSRFRSQYIESTHLHNINFRFPNNPQYTTSFYH